MNLAYRDVRHQWPRFAATALGVGLLLTVVLAMGGIYRGMVEDAVVLVRGMNADLWVVQHGTQGPFAERSALDVRVEDRARTVEGVAWARPFSTFVLQLERPGKPLRVTLVGLGWPDDRGASLPLVRGRALDAARGELLADVGMGLLPGEAITLGEDTFRVVGNTRGVVASGGDAVAFVTHADLVRVAAYASPQVRRSSARSGPAPTTSHAVLVGVQPGASPVDVAARMASWGDVRVFTREQQESLLLEGVIDKARKQIGLFRALLAVVSGIVVSLVVFNMTAARTREIALLKLMGARAQLVAGIVVQQALLLCLLAFSTAVMVSQVAFPLFPRRVVVGPVELGGVLALSVLIALAASLAAVKRALSIPPTTILAG